MILVDSSVWIDFFRSEDTAQTRRLREIMPGGEVLVADLVLAEVLCGVRSDREFERNARALTAFEQIAVCNPDLAIEAARNYRILRACGVTVRGTIDLLIATRCIADDHALLFGDRDFGPFVEWLGLRDGMAV